jgi:hypothetical protein
MRPQFEAGELRLRAFGDVNGSGLGHGITSNGEEDVCQAVRPDGAYCMRME